MSSTTTTLEPSVQWPVKTSEFQNHAIDSTRWDNFPFRDDDVVIASWGKSGTTWMQQIVSQLIFNGSEDAPVHEVSPWLDLRPLPEGLATGLLEAQTHRRFMKTHCPLQNLVYSPKAKYIFCARDGRDVIWSMHNHLYHATPAFYEIMNTPGHLGHASERPQADVREYFLDFIEDDNRSTITYPFWNVIRGWYAAKDTPNLLFVHFNDLKKDLSGEIQRIATFLDIGVTQEKLAEITEHCTFEYMKANAKKMSPEQAPMMWENGAETFINKGSNGRWRDVLTADDIKLYEDKANSELGEECAKWLAEGGRIQPYYF
ncbi:P-loop containing nucleoside triphosphate hydrolase protein, partial [Aureobasidium melanogenum]|uniref:p-loop containing nucleoside triphosphate hydrolase protein n=1 Tax=Aureobasidium melanogenum (strain CBS 110374) TaxID=1043003 RepID=A0A074VEZ5_AURM1